MKAAKRPKVESVYCEVCGIAPVIYAFMPGGDLNDHDATDIMCGTCRLVVATLHHPTYSNGKEVGK